MHCKQRFHHSFVATKLRAVAVVAATAVSASLMMAFPPLGQAQTFKVLYNFSAGEDGVGSGTSLTIDRADNLYGTTRAGGRYNLGGLFQLSCQDSQEAVFKIRYSFRGGNDGLSRGGLLAKGPDGTFYGSTLQGGGSGCYVGYGCGTVFKTGPSSSTFSARIPIWVVDSFITYSNLRRAKSAAIVYCPNSV